MTSGLEHVTIARDDELYEAFPDVCRLSGDRLLCTYRESDYHVGTTSQIMLIESNDRGRTWTNKRPLHFRRTIDETSSVWNNPRLTRLPDGRIVALLDMCHSEYDGDRKPNSLHCYQSYLSFSEDDGETWSDPHLTEVEGLCPDRVFAASDDHWLIATTHFFGRFPGAFRLQVAHSFDGGQTWPIAALGAEEDGFQHDEPSILRLPDGRLLMVMRENVHTHRPSHYVISEDEGRVWSTPRPTPLFGDRPGGGILQSGRILVTYRNVEPAADEKTMVLGRDPGTWAWRGDLEGLTGSGGDSSFLELEHDECGNHGDYGYSGWVQFDDGEIFCIYHHRDDAPKSYIRGCRFSEDDFPG